MNWLDWGTGDRDGHDVHGRGACSWFLVVIVGLTVLAFLALQWLLDILGGLF